MPDSREALRSRCRQLIKEYDLDVTFSIGSMKRQAGKYLHTQDEIRISRHLLDNHPAKVDDILKHEIGHAIAYRRHGTDIDPHGAEWKSVMAELGVEEPRTTHSMQLVEPRYVIACTNDDCETELGRHRRSKLVREPDTYRCGQCGSRLERRR